MLTGRTRYRIGFRKKLVLQVEVWYRPFARNPCTKTTPYGAWRDATIEDMQQIQRGEVEPNRPEPESRMTDPPPKPGSNPPPDYPRPPPPPAPPTSLKPREVESGRVK